MDTPHSVTGIVLAGTYPWRHADIGCLVPRPLLPIAQRPLLSYAVSWLHDGGMTHATISGRREVPALRAAMTSRAAGTMSLSYHADTMPRGAAGSLRDAALRTRADRFVVAEGTAIPNVNLRELLAAHATSGADLTVVVQDDDRSNRADGLQLSSGIYVIERHALDRVPASGFFDLKETLIPMLYQAGRHVAAFTATDPNVRVMDWDTYLAVNGWMIERLVLAGAPLPSYTSVGEALIHATASVARDAVLIGPVMLGSHARVESRAVIVGPCSIGAHAIIEREALVSRSAIWDGATVGRNAVADRTIVVAHAAIEAGVHAYHDVVRRTMPAPEIDDANSVASRGRRAPEIWRRLSRTLLAHIPSARAAR